MVEQYPEHIKLKSVKNESQIIGEFLEYLQEQGLKICRWSDSEHAEGDFFLEHIGIEERLAKYFGIDLNKIESEKRQMLQEMRDCQNVSKN